MTLPKLEDWTAPWETETGEVEIDKPKLKKYLHGLLSDKERLQTTVTTVTGERDTLKVEADKAAREGETEADRLKRENEELKAAQAKSTTESAEKRALRLEVALEKGLTKVQAARLMGDTVEELSADADALLESFGGSGKAGEADGDADKGKPPTRTPRRLANAGDPDGESGDDIDIAKALDSIPRL